MLLGPWYGSVAVPMFCVSPRRKPCWLDPSLLLSPGNWTQIPAPEILNLINRWRVTSEEPHLAPNGFVLLLIFWLFQQLEQKCYLPPDPPTYPPHTPFTKKVGRWDHGWQPEVNPAQETLWESSQKRGALCQRRFLFIYFFFCSQAQNSNIEH